MIPFLPIISPVRLGLRDILSLTALIAAAQENHQLVPVLPKVDPVSWPEVDLQLMDTLAYRVRVSHVPQSHPSQPSLNLLLRPIVSKRGKPVEVWTSTSRVAIDSDRLLLRFCHLHSVGYNRHGGQDLPQSGGRRDPGAWRRLIPEARNSHWMTVYGDYLREVGYAAHKIGLTWDNVSDA